jgi:Tol biopolymer transport system component
VVAVGVIGALIALQGGGNATATVAPTAVAQRATETPDVTATFTLTLSAEDIAATQRSSRRTQTAVALEATSAQQTIDAIINLKDQSDTATAIALTPITATPTASLTPTFTETPVPTATPTASLTPMESPTEQPTTAVAVVSTPESQPLAAGAFGSSGRVMVAYDTYFQLATLASQTQTAIQLAEVGRFAQYQNLRSRISYGAWSPTGSRFVFTSNRSGLWELYMLNADGSNLQKLTFLDSDVAQVGQPCAGFTWSPKGDQIIFTAKDNFMYLLEVASKRARDYGPMTRANLRRIACPAWSPDGNFIYFQSLVSGRTSIGRLEVSSGRVTSTLGEIIPNASELAPSVSPLNDLVAYTLVIDGAWQLNLMQADGTAKRRLYSNEEGQAFPIGWTLDGKAVLFAVQHPEDAPRVYMINVDGTGLRLLAENAFAAYLEPQPQP